MPTKQTVSAVNRFGLGAKPGELAQASDPRGWLGDQLRHAPDAGEFQSLPASLNILKGEYAYRAQRRAEKTANPPAVGNNPSGNGVADVDATRSKRKSARKTAMAADGAQPEGNASRRALARDNLSDIAARYHHAAATSQPFVERLVRFWSNHFAVSVDKGPARLYAAPMEREAIRPHVLGNFSDLLLAVETHPAMLRYLDNAASVGDRSLFVERAARRAQRTDKPARKLGINENLAREILELHTLGADTGYTQADVTELARAITGWGVPLPRDVDAAQTAFAYRQNAHEPGARRLLGKSYAEAGQSQGEAMLRDLALNPATARHLSRKLATHFVSDTPPSSLIDRMAKAYLGSGGQLTALYRTLIDDAAAWSPEARKYKTPDDFVVSAMRAGSIALDARPRELLVLLQSLGQPVFTPRSPAGFPDTASDWAAGDALRKRLQAATTFAERVQRAVDPLQLAQDTLGDAVTGDFAAILRRAGSPQEGYAVVFASPAFQWRA
ncbi:MAG: DUF1800 domain-containing protein [Luteimonas sp.]